MEEIIMIEGKHIEDGSTWIHMMILGVRTMSGTAQALLEIHCKDVYDMLVFKDIGPDLVRFELISKGEE